MKVVVVGNGIAGRAVTAMLLRKPHLCWDSLITVIEPSSSSSSSSSDLHTGLWSPSVKILNDTLDIPYQKWLEVACPVRDSGYRAVDGSWLMKPYRGMQCPPNAPSLSFARNQDILKLLDQSILDGNKNHRPITLRQDVSVTSINLSNRKVILSDDSEIDADLIIGADGVNSRMREIVYGKSNRHLLKYRGYKVYRGHTRYSELSDETLSILTDHAHTFDSPISDHVKAFQTWGPGARFALVPTLDGVAWFAAVSHPQIQRFYWQMNGHGPCNEALNFPILESEHELERLQTIFAKWHRPIPDLLATAKSDKMVATYALSSVDVSDNLVKESQGATIALIGDAAHTLDPILAQGAGIAIEDAYHLVNSLDQICANSKLSGLQSNDLSIAYLTKRGSRVRRLHHISDLAQSLGHMESSKLISLRNIALQVVPNAIGGRIFDKFIEFSS